MSALIDERALSKLRWRCRRGLLENDLFVERFFEASAGRITERQAEGMLALMDLPDNDLLDLLLRRKEPEGELARDDVIEVLGLMRTPIATEQQREDDPGPTRARPVETSPASTPLRH
ncbi:succinate dehydrogenase assembly factor 2 [Piscinibacter aquaticus]|uniref:FAD assembly factor SdhE n=1 Tax=Piscinibacter aquaticus TaxID=392597 RepID=A0A5C6U0J4_9BURK|nr:succinate dehydrogenase assembly factor 2 [Piscinibacter aquaticus]